MLERVEHSPIVQLSFGGYKPPIIADWRSVSPDVSIKSAHLHRLTNMDIDLSYWEKHIADADIIELTDSSPNLRQCRIGAWDNFESGRRHGIKHRKGTPSMPL